MNFVPYVKCLLCLFLIPIQTAVAQDAEFISAQRAGGTLSDAGMAVAVDEEGNVVVTGFARDVSTFGSQQITSAGIDDIFVAKYDPAGNALWAVSAGGTGADEGRGVDTDGDGNIAVTGRFFDSAMFGSTNLTSAAGWDAFLAKYAPDGSVLWALSIGGDQIDEGYDVAFDPSGNVYATGSFAGNAVVGDSTFTSFGQEDMYVAKFDPNGNFLWAQRAGSQFFEQGHGVAADPDGNVFVSGRFSGMSTFGDTTISVNRIFNSFIAKYDADGNFQWVRKAGGRDDFSYDIDADGLGNAYAVGYFQQSASFGDSTLTSTGSGDVYIAKYNPDGDLVWVVQGGSDDTDEGFGVAVDDVGNVVATGYFTGTATFGDTTLTATFKEIFLAKYDADGDFLWAASAGGDDIEEGAGVDFNPAGDVVVTGHFSSAATFGTAEITSAGETDIFLATFGSGGDPTAVEIGLVPSAGFAVHPNYPNPFSESTVIPVDMEDQGRLRITMHDLLGREVRLVSEAMLPAGRHEVEFRPTDLSAGVYLMRVASGKNVQSIVVSLMQ
jgi:hypothetical protein